MLIVCETCGVESNKGAPSHKENCEGKFRAIDDGKRMSVHKIWACKVVGSTVDSYIYRREKDHGLICLYLHAPTIDFIDALKAEGLLRSSSKPRAFFMDGEKDQSFIIYSVSSKKPLYEFEAI